MWKPLLLIFLVILTGTIGYSVIENLNILDSLYMTVITIFTAGFREMKQPLSPTGQFFMIFIILGGAGTATMGFTKLAEIAFGAVS
jgi:voltage-gated potassium channel